MIKTILVDDEVNNSEYVAGLLEQHFPSLKVVATCSGARDAVHIIEKTQPHLVFLDVEMPGLNGFSVLQNLEPVNFEVIFITAYDQYALQAFDVHAMGYLTKPLQVSRFIKTTAAAIEKIERKNFNGHLFNLLAEGNSTTPIGQTQSKIALPTQNGLLFLDPAEILYCQSSGNYTKFFTKDGKNILVSRQLGEFEKILPQQSFHRIHDQYMVHLLYIKEYVRGRGGELVLENNETLPVSVSRKDIFLSRFEKWLRKN